MTTLLAPSARTPFAPAPALDDATRRQFLAPLAAAGLVAACGRDDTASTGAGTTRSTRSIEHTSGTTDVPVAPMRIVSLDNSITIGLIALGLSAIDAAADLPAYLTDLADLLPAQVDIPATATNEDLEPNVEAVAAPPR